MKRHYHRYKVYRRHPGPGGRPVYYMPMDRYEVHELHVLYCVIGTMAALIGAIVLWGVSMV